jgi:hypothetical protein
MPEMLLAVKGYMRVREITGAVRTRTVKFEIRTLSKGTELTGIGLYARNGNQTSPELGLTGLRALGR